MALRDTEDERGEELDTLVAIYPELVVDPSNAFSATLELAVSPASPMMIRFMEASQEPNSYAAAATVTHEMRFSHLPPLTLHINLPEGYPAEKPPLVKVSTELDWLPGDKITELEDEVANLWETYGQTLFVYIDHVQQVADRGFDLEKSDGCLVLSTALEPGLIAFDTKALQETFDAGTYDCGICLEPKKGSMCYSMKHCHHVFCRECLQGVYNNAIKEGDVVQVKCLEPGCAVETTDASGRKRKRKTERTVHPRELLAMGVEEDMVRRFVEMKRKKKLEADKTTVYCPRAWCQGPAKSDKYPPIPADLTTYVAEVADDSDVENGAEADTPSESRTVKNVCNIPPDPTDRLAVCEKCSLAFCKVCYMGWHGPFARCYPRDPSELSAEEQASYDYIRSNTSPCPHCSAPVQKTMGCNHMNCFNCNTHFCYLCGFWLDGQNPYQHFNKGDSKCYGRLWELEEGDEGQGPEDGRGFGGGRRYEQMAIEAAREAEAAEEAARLQAEENARALPAAPQPPANGIPLAVVLAQLNLNGVDFGGDLDHVDNEVDDHWGVPQPRVIEPPQQPGRAARRQRNPFPARPPGQGQAQAQAVRDHERAGRAGRRAGGRRPPGARAGDEQVDVDDREQINLANFLDMARRDAEDEWDSDELGDDDQGFVIPPR